MILEYGTRIFVEIDGKKIEIKPWRVTQFFGESGPVVIISEDVVKKISSCDCGAEKVSTTHADWCSTT